jgi:hypothetical protein
MRLPLSETRAAITSSEIAAGGVFGQLRVSTDHLVLFNALEPQAVVWRCRRPRRNQVMGYGEGDPGHQDGDGQDDDAADDGCGVSVVG